MIPYLHSNINKIVNPLRHSQFLIDFDKFPSLNKYVQGFSKSKNKTIIKFIIEDTQTSSHLGFKRGVEVFDIINQEKIFNISFILFNEISENVMIESDSFIVDDYSYYMDYSSSNPAILEVTFIKHNKNNESK